MKMQPWATTSRDKNPEASNAKRRKLLLFFDLSVIPEKV